MPTSLLPAIPNPMTSLGKSYHCSNTRPPASPLQMMGTSPIVTLMMNYSLKLLNLTPTNLITMTEYLHLQQSVPITPNIPTLPHITSFPYPFLLPQSYLPPTPSLHFSDILLMVSPYTTSRWDSRNQVGYSSSIQIIS